MYSYLKLSRHFITFKVLFLGCVDSLTVERWKVGFSLVVLVTCGIVIIGQFSQEILILVSML